MDSVQAAHALKNRNGLRILDLSRACDPLAFEHECSAVCLVRRPIRKPNLIFGIEYIQKKNGWQVCGKTVLDIECKDAMTAAAYVAPMHDRDDDVRRVSVMRRIALRNGLRLTSRWNSLVHSR